MSIRTRWAERLRAMYPGGRAGPAARRLSRLWAAAMAAGLFPRRWVALEVAGRRSGRPLRYPLGMADVGGHWYLVPMLGGQSGWVRNVRAADGRVTIRHGRATACRLVEVPVPERPVILRRYLAKVPGGRPHIPVDRRAPLAEFAAIAPRYPVFRVEPAGPGIPPGRSLGSRILPRARLGGSVPGRAAGAAAGPRSGQQQAPGPVTAGQATAGDERR